jgi:DNA helicase-2/ATP-dependent DNA helicase PcrA
MVRRGIPYQVVGGPRFYERAEVKDLLSYLRVVVNPADLVSLTRMAGAPKRGLGPGCMGRLAAFAETHGMPVADAMGQAELVSGVQPAQRRALGRLAELIADLRQAAAAGATLDRLMEEALDGSGLRAALEAEGTIEAQGRLENLAELVTLAAEYQAQAEEPSLAAFLEEVALQADADQVDQGAGRVTLMTIHNAKGLEFDTVIITGLEEGIFPHARSDTPEALEEERRLCYVGLTRARRRLVLTHAQSRAIYGGRDYRLPSRFLGELPADALSVAPGVPLSVAMGTSRGLVGRSERPPEDLHTGDSVVHATFGEGVIIGVESGGELVRVRFAQDGAERRLMAGSAPMRKVS